MKTQMTNAVAHRPAINVVESNGLDSDDLDTFSLVPANNHVNYIVMYLNICTCVVITFAFTRFSCAF